MFSFVSLTPDTASQAKVELFEEAVLTALPATSDGLSAYKAAQADGTSD